MPDPLAPADPGLLASILDTARLGGFAVRNLLKGNLEGVGRNAVDILGRGADALLPGDWISDISRPEDRPEFRDVVDLGGDNIGTDILNFAGDMATDPVSYLPGSLVAKAGGLVGKGVGKVVSKLPAAIQEPLVQGATSIGQKVRSVAGAQRLSPAGASAVAAKQAASELVGRTGAEGTVGALGGLTDKELNALGQAGHNLRLDPATGRPASVLDESGSMNMEQRLRKLMGEDPELSPERLLAALPKAQSTLKSMWDAGQEAATSPGGGVFFRSEAPAVPDVVMGGMKHMPNEGVQDYFPKQFSGLKEDEIDALTGLPKDFGRAPDLAGIPSPVKERLDWKAKDVLDYLTRNPKVNLEFNAGKAMAQRAATQGELAGRAQIGQSLFDRAAAGEVALPDELARTLAAKQNPAQRAVVGASNAGADVGQMLGGAAKEQALPESPNLMMGGSSYSAPVAEAVGRQGKLSDNLLMGGLKEKEAVVPKSKAVVGQAERPPEYGPAAPVTDAERKSAQDYLKSNSFRYADPDLRSAAQAIAKQLPQEEATVLLNALNGLAPRGAFTNALAKLNTYFKGPAVFGAIVPKLGAITRNLTGGLFQQMANAEARGDTVRAAVHLVPNWLKSIDDGVEKLFGKRITTNEFADIDKAFKLAAGDPRKVAQHIADPTMRTAVEKGVLGNNFIDTEGLIKSVAKGGWKAFGKNMLDYPAAMFKGAEQRMRYGLFKSLLAKGKTADEAARVVTDTFFDYSHSSVGNRTMRDVFPFAQYAMKAIPQQAKFLAQKPLALSAVANLSGGSQGDPLYPWMQGKINIPIGQDEQGNQQYISSLGLPSESLGLLPNPSADLLQMGRQLEQNIVGASQPLLKTAYSAVSGRDPYFGSQYGSYGKLPVVGEAGATGRLINQLLSSGLPGATQASGVLGAAGKLSDPRTSAMETITSLLTGAKITSVDESRALQQQLEEALKRDPSVAQYTSLSNRGGSDSTQALLAALKAAKAEIKAKRKALLPGS